MALLDDVQAVLFDAHGTLITIEDPVPALQRGLADAGYDYGLPVVAAAFRTEVRVYMQNQDLGRDTTGLDVLRELCGATFAMGLPAGPPPGVARDILVHAVRHRVYEDVIPTLDALDARGLRCGVVSNMDCSLSGTLVELGLAERFASLSVSAVVGARKPDPRIFTHALGTIGVEAQRALYVGDDPHVDIDGARAAGIRAVLIDRAGNHPEAPDRILELQELLA